jgi:hypothetical protein
MRQQQVCVCVANRAREARNPMRGIELDPDECVNRPAHKRLRTFERAVSEALACVQLN